MDKYRKSFYVMKASVMHTLMQARFYVSILLVTVLMNQAIYPIRAFSKDIGIATCPWIMPFLTQVFYLQMIIVLGIVFLFCDVPTIGNGRNYILIRIGRKAWFWGQVGYILVMTLIYSSVIFGISILLFFPSIRFENSWGKILGTIAQTSLGDQFAHVLDYQLMVNYTPFEAMLGTFFIVWLVGIFTASLMLTFNVYFKSIVGAVVGCIIAFTPYFVGNANNISVAAANYIAPAVWMNIMKTYQLESVNYPNGMYIFSFLIIGSILCIGISYLRIRHKIYDF